jgi:WW domain-binding protein 11
MAKGYNPADAHRKAEKKKAAKKNKQDRQTAKELNDVKKGTGCRRGWR